MKEKTRHKKSRTVIEYRHTIESLLGNLLKGGFILKYFFESNDDDKIYKHFPKYFTMCLLKLIKYYSFDKRIWFFI